jgi:hypothetical protein
MRFLTTTLGGTSRVKKLQWTSVFLILLITTLLPFGSYAGASGQASEITVVIDSRPIYFDVTPQRIEGRVMVPLRAIFESLGAEVEWEGTTQTITGKKDDTIITLRINDILAEVSGRTVELDVAAAQVEGRTFVPARFVAESFGADVDWDESNAQVIISTGAAAPDGRYYFVYNSQAVTAEDLGSIKLFANKFRQTRNVLLDTADFKTAAELYDALKGEQKKLGGVVAGVQIFGVAEDVPAFSYVHKMKVMEDNGRWNGIEYNTNEKFVTDFFYSTFKNDSKHLKDDVTVYSIVTENLPVSIVPEWPVSRLPLTKGEISSYITSYDQYRQQAAGKPTPTVVLSAPSRFQDGYVQNDVGLIIESLKDGEEFSLFKNTDLRIHYKDLAASLTQENKSGVMDLVIGSEGDNEGAAQEGVPFFDRKSVTELDDNYYTAFFWGMTAAKGLNTDSIVHDGLTKGKMINPISHTVMATNGGVANYVWTKIDTPEGETGDNWYDYVAVNKELLQQDNPFFFVYKYYEELETGKSRLQSFHDAKAAYANLSMSNKKNFVAAFGYENVISLHYLGLADYES